MGPSTISFLSFRIIFHFHDYGRKGSLPTCHFVGVIYIYICYLLVFKEGTFIFQAILVALLLPPTAGCSSRVVPLHVNSEPQSIVSLVHGEQHVYDLGLSKWI